jgi:hypothetical protein
MIKKYILISFLIALAFSGFAQSVKRIHLDSLTYSNQVFSLNGKLFTGLAFSTFNSGNIKSEWDIFNGIPHGNVIGYHEYTQDSIFKFSYKYTYENGVKVGKQYEYYLREENIPFYQGYDSTKATKLQWIIKDFDKIYFGNKDGLSKIDFYQSEGCSVNTDKTTGELRWPTNEECPSGRLIVYYEALDLPGYKSKKLFEKCYGPSKCFWRIHRYNNAWYWE